MGIVGGNLADIGANEASLRTTGGLAVTSGTATGAAAANLQGAIVEATGALVREFERIAGELTSDIERASRQLEATDWQGQSREQAVLIETDLKGQVNQVMRSAATSMAAEQDAFCKRADALVGEIEDKFTRVMEQVEIEYAALGTAARVTAERLEAADQTIRMG